MSIKSFISFGTNEIIEHYKVCQNAADAKRISANDIREIEDDLEKRIEINNEAEKAVDKVIRKKTIPLIGSRIFTGHDIASYNQKLQERMSGYDSLIDTDFMDVDKKPPKVLDLKIRNE